jgi:hypothetical protein
LFWVNPSFWVIQRRRPFPIPSRNFLTRCKEILEPMMLRIAPAAALFSAYSARRCDAVCRIGKWQVSSSI